MSINPKIEFFRFKLKHKTGDVKNFRNFMVENGKCKNKDNEAVIFGKLYGYFMNDIKVDFAKSESIKKVMTLISNRGRRIINKHWDERPKPDLAKNIIAGVVNGGTYGKERIVTKLTKKDETNSLAVDQPVLQYYYIFLYLPVDHNEGFMMIHTDSAEESISDFARKYLADLFSIGDYQKPTMRIFAPKCFQEEYKDGAVVKTMSFQTTYVDNQIEDNNPIKEILGDYDVKITITPKGEGDKSLNVMEMLRDYLKSRFFGAQNYTKQLGDFEKCTVSTRNEQTKTSKTFDWDLRDSEMAPVVYLNGKVAINEDGTVNLAALDTYCKDLFETTIKKELRPDLYVEGMA